MIRQISEGKCEAKDISAKNLIVGMHDNLQKLMSHRKYSVHIKIKVTFALFLTFSIIPRGFCGT